MLPDKRYEPDRLAELTSADFAAHLHQTFQVYYGAASPLPLELVQVTELPSRNQPGQRQPFFLIFLGQKSDQYLSQRVYRFEQETLGVLDLFIVPLGLAPTDRERMQYQAIFN
jgi:hypothetical protein